MPELFDGPTVEAVDDRFNYGETRTNSLGEIEASSSPLPGVASIAESRRKGPPPSPPRQPKNARDRARSLKPEERPMVDERPRLGASEIEEELFAALQKLPTLHDTQSVTIRPYSGPKSWTWELDRIEPEVGPEQSKFADVMAVVARLQQQYDLDLSPPPPA
jgi:hypothetical protein